MKVFTPKVVRVNKTFDKHKTLQSVEYFHELTFQQRTLLNKILDLWGNGKVEVGSSIPHNWIELTKIIRLALRTNEYSEKIQADLIQIRNWYVMYLQMKKR